MDSFTELDCVYSNCTIKRYGDSLVEVIYNKVPSLGGSRRSSDEEKEFTGKLDNNLIRAKTKIRDYVLSNNWDWWVTLTLNPSWFDRYDLPAFVKSFGEMIHNYNRRSGRSVKYLIVPEKHPTSGAWHFHGFLSGIPEEDIVINEYGYYNWVKYTDNFGYMSMSRIRDKMRAANYITKYLTKTMAENVTACGAHTYYCSKGLCLPSVSYGDVFVGVPWDYVGQYCNKLSFTPEQLKTDDLSFFDIFNEIPKSHLTSFPLNDIISYIRAGEEEKKPLDESLQIKMGL